jgi:hypothetical protein
MARAMDFLDEGDFDGDGLPNAWEFLHFGSSTGANPEEDSDGDRLSNQAEYIAGTDPRSAGSVLSVDSMQTDTNAATLVFRWPSVTGRVYSVLRATNMLGAFTQHVGGIAATAPTNAYTNAAPAAPGWYYYGIGVSWPAAP